MISKQPQSLAVDPRGGDAKHLRRFSDRQPLHPLKVAICYPLPLPSEFLTFAACSSKAGVDPLPDALPLELGKAAHHTQQQVSGWTGCVNALVETDESDVGPA